MRSPRFGRAAVTGAALALLAGCQAYMPSDAPLGPGTEVVRLALARPRDIVLARGTDAGGARADTISGVTAVYGRVVALRGDTLRMVVTQLGRSGALQHTPSGRNATLHLSDVAGVERWSHSPRRTAALGFTMGALVLAVGIGYAILIGYVGG